MTFFRSLEEQFPGAKVVYDGPSKHGSGNDLLFTVPVHGLMSSLEPVEPRELSQKVYALKRILLEEQLKALQAEL